MHLAVIIPDRNFAVETLVMGGGQTIGIGQATAIVVARNVGG